MKKKKFRILGKKVGFLILYISQVKVWYGWRGMSAYREHGYILYGPNYSSENRKNAMDNITDYCLIKGIKPEDIEILEVIK
jgi:hypothetical protein